MKNLQKILVLVAVLAGGFLVSAESEFCPEVTPIECVCSDAAGLESVCLEPECVVEDCTIEAEASQPSLTVVLPGNRVITLASLLCDVPVAVASEVADTLMNACPELMTALSLTRADLVFFVSNAAALVKYRVVRKVVSVDVDGVRKDFYPTIVSPEAKDSIERARLGVRAFASKLVVDDAAFESLAQYSGAFKLLIVELAAFLTDLSSDNDEQSVAALVGIQSRIDAFSKKCSATEFMQISLLFQLIIQPLVTSELIVAFLKKEVSSVDVYNLYTQKIVVFVDRPAVSGACEAICVPDKKEVYTDLATLSDDLLTLEQGCKLSFIRDPESKVITLFVGSDISVLPLAQFVPIEEDFNVSDVWQGRKEMAIAKAENVIVFNN